MQGMCMHEWCAVAVTIETARVSLLGERGAVCLQYAAWRPVSSSAGLYALLSDSTEQFIACPPSQRGHSRFWCYSDRRSAYALRYLSVIWPSVLFTISGALIPERNGLSQFNEDTGKPSVPVQEFNLIACPVT